MGQAEDRGLGRGDILCLCITTEAKKEGRKGGPGVGPRGREVNFDRTDVETLKAPWSMPVHCCSQQTRWRKRCEGE